MVKTRSDVKGVRVSGKAPRKISMASTNAPTGRTSKKYNGSNSYCPREVPPWQKEITQFFSPEQNKAPNAESPCSSSGTTLTQSDQ